MSVGWDAPVAAARRLVAIYLELSKARLSCLVVFTSLAGVVLASPARINWLTAFFVTLGTTLAAFGANALNQWCERERDALMLRTQKRPLPSGRIGATHALLFGIASGVAGPLLMYWTVNPQAAALTLATLLLYVLVYTPCKPLTSINTLIGAVVGALPPLIGWVAVAGEVSTGGWVLGALLFVWQIPHFLALAWLYREDYQRGGYRMLPQLDPSGMLTGFSCTIHSLALIPLALMLSLSGRTGLAFAIGGALLGTYLVVQSARFWAEPERPAAKRLFLASVLYLPLLLILMLADRQPGGLLGAWPPVAISLLQPGTGI